MEIAPLLLGKLKATFEKLSTDLRMEIPNLRIGITYDQKDGLPLIDLWMKNTDPGTMNEQPLIPIFIRIDDDPGSQPVRMFLDIKKVIPLVTHERMIICAANGSTDAYKTMQGTISGSLKRISKDKNIPLEKVRGFIYMIGEGYDPELYLFNDTDPVCPLTIDELVSLNKQESEQPKMQ